MRPGPSSDCTASCSPAAADAAIHPEPTSRIPQIAFRRRCGVIGSTGLMQIGLDRRSRRQTNRQAVSSIKTRLGTKRENWPATRQNQRQCNQVSRIQDEHRHRHEQHKQKAPKTPGYELGVQKWRVDAVHGTVSQCRDRTESDGRGMRARHLGQCVVDQVRHPACRILAHGARVAEAKECPFPQHPIAHDCLFQPIVDGVSVL